MPKHGESADKAQKTGVLIAVGNVLLSPLYYADTKLGLAASLALTSAAIYKLHELGKSRRPGANTLNQVNTFFSSQTDTRSSEIENSFRNVVNGGAAIFDEFVPS